MLWRTAIFGAALMLLVLGEEASDTKDEEATTAAAAVEKSSLGVSVTDFGKNMMGELLKTEGDDKNIVISPLTVHLLLYMLYLGSDKETHSQISKGMAMKSKDSAKSLKSYSDLSNSYQKISDEPKSSTNIRIANAMFVQEGVTVKPDYDSQVKTSLKAPVHNFKSPADGAKQLNDFVNNRTNGMIDKIAEPTDIGENTKMILASACYFKASWKIQFKEKRTKEMEFELVGGGEKVKLEHGMRGGRNDKYRIAKLDTGCRILELPYKDSNFNMYIGLPEKNTLEALNKLAVGLDYNSFESKLKSTKVFVQLPRFETGTTLTLNAALAALGMTDMFDAKADFSKMADAAAQVSQVTHKTKIKVNEEGSEAAAVAVAMVSFRSYSAPTKPEEFIVDRPFVFMIHDKANGNPLFVGRVMNPAA